MISLGALTAKTSKPSAAGIIWFMGFNSVSKIEPVAIFALRVSSDCESWEVSGLAFAFDFIDATKSDSSLSMREANPETSMEPVAGAPEATLLLSSSMPDFARPNDFSNVTSLFLMSLESVLRLLAWVRASLAAVCAAPSCDLISSVKPTTASSFWASCLLANSTASTRAAMV